MGTVVFPILTYLVSGWMMGWASAPYDPGWAARFPRRAAWMALAGPMANLAIAVATGLVIHAFILDGAFAPPETVRFTAVAVGAAGGWSQGAAVFASILFTLNLVLFSFNLIPLPPLDGGAAVTLLMPDRLATRYRSMMSNPTIALFGLVFAWQAYGSIFRPLFRFAIGCLYPGRF